MIMGGHLHVLELQYQRFFIKDFLGVFQRTLEIVQSAVIIGRASAYDSTPRIRLRQSPGIIFIHSLVDAKRLLYPPDCHIMVACQRCEDASFVTGVRNGSRVRTLLRCLHERAKELPRLMPVL